VISDRHDAAITQGIISMAHHLKLKVIAEGVETESQVAFLRRSHCDEFQGYYFARPIPLATLESFLLQQRAKHDLPVVADSAANAAESSSQTLLLLDDEENILRALTRVLRRDGYHVLTANRAQDAFALLAKHEVQVILSDQRMPEMNGTAFFSRVKDLYPDTIRIVLSGYTDLNSVTEAINQGAIYKFLTKPWDDAQLRATVAQAFRHHELAQPKEGHSAAKDHPSPRLD
jgi:CheY-like chemotaxis protein